MIAWLTVRQAAQRLNGIVSVKTLYDHLDRGTLRGCKLGGRWAIDPADLDAWVAASWNRPADGAQAPDPGRDRAPSPRRKGKRVNPW